jgi:hypothetical protein
MVGFGGFGNLDNLGGLAQNAVKQLGGENKEA